MTAEGATCFVGSSTEGLGYANALVEHLTAAGITCELWPLAFDIGKTAVEALEDALNRHSFAVLIATADDLTTSRRKARMAPRDNVVLEFGLFVGRLRRERAFLLIEETDKGVKLPSDLLGVTLGPFRSRKGKQARKNSMRAPAAKVAAQIEKLGPLETPTDPAVSTAVLNSASGLMDELREMPRAAMTPRNRRSGRTRCSEPFTNCSSPALRTPTRRGCGPTATP